VLREQYAHARQDGWKEDATIEYECNGKLLTKQTDKPLFHLAVKAIIQQLIHLVITAIF